MSRTLFRLLAALLFGAIALLPITVLVQQKGGEEETGPYDVVAIWPQQWAKQGYIWGSQPGVFAETPNRIFIASRGELKLPDPLPRGFTNEWGSLGERATTPKAEMRNCILVVDGEGKLIESWTQWDKLFIAAGGTGEHELGRRLVHLRDEVEVLHADLAGAAAAARPMRAGIGRAPAEGFDLDLTLVLVVLRFAVDAFELQKIIYMSHDTNSLLHAVHG